MESIPRRNVNLAEDLLEGKHINLASNFIEMKCLFYFIIYTYILDSDWTPKILISFHHMSFLS